MLELRVMQFLIQEFHAVGALHEAECAELFDRFFRLQAQAMSRLLAAIK